jgi:hypothetical protein
MCPSQLQLKKLLQQPKLARQAVKFWCCNTIGSKITSSGEVKHAACLNVSQEMSSMGMCKRIHVCESVRERERNLEYTKIADPPKQW